MRLVKVAAGILIAWLVWRFVAPEYAFVPKRLAGAAARWFFDRGWTVDGAGENAIVYRADGSIAATVFMRYLTTNLMTLLILFSLSDRPLSWRNIGGAVAGVVALVPIHAIGILIVAKSLVLPNTLWGNLAQAYTIFGSHAIAFALWWALRPQEGIAAAGGKKRRRKK